MNSCPLSAILESANSIPNCPGSGSSAEPPWPVSYSVGGGKNLFIVAHQLCPSNLVRFCRVSVRHSSGFAVECKAAALGSGVLVLESVNHTTTYL